MTSPSTPIGPDPMSDSVLPKCQCVGTDRALVIEQRCLALEGEAEKRCDVPLGGGGLRQSRNQGADQSQDSETGPHVVQV